MSKPVVPPPTPDDPRIVVGVDGSSSSEHALAWATRQAQMTDASLEVLTAWHWPDYGWGMLATSDYNPMDDAQKLLDEALKPVLDTRPALRVAGKLVGSHPAPALVDASRGADILVVGSRGHGEFAGMLLGSVSGFCATHAHCPVLVFREPPADAGTQRIVVGVDGADSSVHALDWAVGQAEMTGAGLEVVTTWAWPTTYGQANPIPNDYDLGAETNSAIENLLAPIRSTHPGLDIRLEVVEGHPAQVLTDTSRHADLLVVGSRGHGAFAGMMLGSVSEHCVSNAHCPVVVFREGR